MENTIIANKYKIIKKLSEGNFSEVYIGKHINKNENVVIKFEDNINTNILEHEAEIYLYLMRQKINIKIPKFKLYGIIQNYNYIILEKMEKSLKDIIKNNELNLDDVLKIGIQLIDFLEKFHNQKLIHRDIKTENILFNNKNNIFLIDFGLSTTYKPTYNNYFNEKTSSKEYREYIKSKGKNKFVGNLMFASPYVHDGYDYYPKDDLISISYLLIYLYYKELPWSIFKYKDKKPEIIKALKKYVDVYSYYNKYHIKGDEELKNNPLFILHSNILNISFGSVINYNKYKEYLTSFLDDKNIYTFSWNNNDI
ncbi:hypothetical protein CL656_06095 [bacterium]|nr:hypothetical protein [bacterium]|tara:strand:- start:459 stop:1388 length:930 start_codon:yes stop_codon:yes gene_type:complete